MKPINPMHALPGQVTKRITGDYLRSLVDSDAVKDRLDYLAELYERSGKTVAFEIIQPKFDTDDVLFVPNLSPPSAPAEFADYASRFREDAKQVIYCLTHHLKKPHGLTIAIFGVCTEDKASAFIPWMTRRENRKQTHQDSRPIQVAYIYPQDGIHLMQYREGSPLHDVPPKSQRASFLNSIEPSMHHGFLDYYDRTFTDLDVLDDFAFDCVKV